MIVIIPARGKSKRLPDKNLKLFNGLPLIVHTIIAAKNCTEVSEIFVITDSASIANVSLEHGAKIPFIRPSYLATDDSPAIDTYLFTIDYLSNNLGYSFSEIIVLLPTAPLRDSSDISNAISLWRNAKADSLLSVSEVVKPVEWIITLDDHGNLSKLDKNCFSEESIYLIPNGAIYIFDVLSLKKNKSYYTGKTIPYIMPVNKSIDIDNELDFKIAEFIHKSKHNF